MHWIDKTRRTLALVLLLHAAAGARAQLNWEGQGGIFINPLAYPTAAGKLEASVHHIDLDRFGTLQTIGVSGGLGHGIEVGFTHIRSTVDGVYDQNVVPLKWQFVKERPDAPAIAASAVFRDLNGHGSATDYGVTATKVLRLGSSSVALSAGGRVTKALGVGLFGINGAYQVRWEGAVAVFVTKRLILGAEIKQQIDARAWRDVALRYVLSDHAILDLGIANFGTGLDNQLAIGFTFRN